MTWIRKIGRHFQKLKSENALGIQLLIDISTQNHSLKIFKSDKLFFFNFQDYVPSFVVKIYFQSSLLL